MKTLSHFIYVLFFNIGKEDIKWGIGLGITDSRNQNPDNWTGENLLGFALMEVRDKIKNHE